MINRILKQSTVFLLSGVFLAGCLTPSTIVPPKQYILAPDIPVSQSESVGLSLGMRALNTARPYAKPNIAFLTEDNLLGYYPDVLWAEQPATVLTRELLDVLDASGAFTDTGDAASMSRPDLVLTGELRKFHEERSGEGSSAVVEIRLELRNPKEAKLLWAETISRSEIIDGSGPEAVSAAMERTITAIVEQARFSMLEKLTNF